MLGTPKVVVTAPEPSPAFKTGVIAPVAPEKDHKVPAKATDNGAPEARQATVANVVLKT